MLIDIVSFLELCATLHIQYAYPMLRGTGTVPSAVAAAEAERPFKLYHCCKSVIS